MASAATKDPQTVANDWASKLGGSVPKIKAGVMNVPVAPTQLAAKNAQGYVNGVTNAVNSGKWQNGLNRVSLQDWQNATIQKGSTRIATGAQSAIPKMAAFMQQWLPYMTQLQQKLATMPKGDINASIARATAAIQFNAAFKRQG